MELPWNSSLEKRPGAEPVLESNLEASQRLLGQRCVSPSGRVRFRVAENQHIQILHEPDAPHVKMGAGIPTIALRAGTEESLLAWHALDQAGLR
jgi:hypothetical protein